MADHHTRPTAIPRARAVGDLPLERLLARAENLTRRWAIGLIAAWPMERLGSIPLNELAADGAAVCRAVLRALASDEELGRLLEDVRERSALEGLAVLTGAADAGTLIEAVETLRGVTWEALLDELAGSSSAGAPRALADAGDRLAYVCASLLAELLDEIPLAEPRPGESPQPGFPVRPVRSARRAPSAGKVVILDDRGESSTGQAEEPSEPEPRGWDEPPPPAGRGPIAAELGEAPGALPADAPGTVAAAGFPEIEIRDERREEGPAAWIGSIGRQLEQFAADRRPFAVLLVEPLDVQPASAERAAEGLAPALSRLERLLADELAVANGGWLTRERPGRYWLLAPQTDRMSAHTLVERLAATVRGAAGRLGTQLEVAVGTAVCPDDGQSAPALAAHADIGLYAARADARAAAARPRVDGGGRL